MKRVFIWISLFAIGMAFLESAVVVYLRALYYPEGFAFPLKTMDSTLALTELLREGATMLMLVSVSALASKRFSVALAWFLYAFAIWDIFYYIFLYLLIGWPSSLMTWDILFLLPVMWTGPVLAPVLNACTMILLALVILNASGQNGRTRLSRTEWTFLLAGSVITIIGYTMDYMSYMLSRFHFIKLITFQDYNEILKYSSSYIPTSFPWLIFLTGELLFLIAISVYYHRRTAPIRNS